MLVDGRKAERQKGRKAERQKGRKAERQKGRKAERQKGRKAERQKGRKAEISTAQTSGFEEQFTELQVNEIKTSSAEASDILTTIDLVQPKVLPVPHVELRDILQRPVFLKKKKT